MIPLNQQTIDAAEIATALGYSKNYFLRIVKKLETDHAMPPRLPGKRWSRTAMEHWLKSYNVTSRMRSIDPSFGTIELQRLMLAKAYAGARP